MTENTKGPHWEFITLAAAAMLMVMMGARQSMGLFVAPMNVSTGLGLMTISFAMAVNQFVWGAVQPLTGALADRYGAGRVLLVGVLIFALGSALTPEVATSLGLVLTIGLLSAVGAGAEVLHEPREWPEYHPGYYGAFVRDPDGNNVEAVCHFPE